MKGTKKENRRAIELLGLALAASGGLRWPGMGADPVEEKPKTPEELEREAKKIAKAEEKRKRKAEWYKRTEFRTLVKKAIKENKHIEVCEKFSVSITTVKRWAAGTSQPHMIMLDAALPHLRKLLGGGP